MTVQQYLPPPADFQRENSFENIEKVAPLWIARPNGKSWNFGRHSHIGRLRKLRLMTKFMPVRKMQIYFLSVASYKKALEGLHLHLLLLEWARLGGGWGRWVGGGAVWEGGVAGVGGYDQCRLSKSSTDKEEPKRKYGKMKMRHPDPIWGHICQSDQVSGTKMWGHSTDCTKLQFVKQLCRAKRAITHLIAN